MPQSRYTSAADEKDGSLRVLLTSPFAHPYVRRGVERYVGELAEWLQLRGHDVTVLATAPDRSRIEVSAAGVASRFVRARKRAAPPRWSLAPSRWRTDDLARTFPALSRAALRLREFDIVEAHHYPDAAALRATRLRGRPRYSLWLPGVPRRSSLSGYPLNRALALFGLDGAGLLLALSRYAGAVLREDFGLDAEILPPGVDTALYAGPKPPVSTGEILCPVALDDPRKGVELLLQAFPEVVRHRPSSRLVLAPPRAELAEKLLRGLEPTVLSRVTVTVPRDSGHLAEMYRRASVTVLPSVGEAFGLVLVESLAAGSPVVGVRDGGVPEVIDDDSIGRLAMPDDVSSLTRAILETLDLAASDGSSELCRAAARRWDWAEIGPRWEQLHGL